MLLFVTASLRNYLGLPSFAFCALGLTLFANIKGWLCSLFRVQPEGARIHFVMLEKLKHLARLAIAFKPDFGVDEHFSIVERVLSTFEK